LLRIEISSSCCSTVICDTFIFFFGFHFPIVSVDHIGPNLQISMSSGITSQKGNNGCSIIRRRWHIWKRRKRLPKRGILLCFVTFASLSFRSETFFFNFFLIFFFWSNSNSMTTVVREGSSRSFFLFLYFHFGLILYTSIPIFHI
jgi:hypothetical protein